MTKKQILLAATGLMSLCSILAFTNANDVIARELTLLFPDHKPSVAPLPVAPDTLPPLRDRYDDFIGGQSGNIIDLQDPKAIEQNVEYDPVSNSYILTEKIGDEYYRAPTYMTFEEYLAWRDRKQREEYFDRLQGKEEPGSRNKNGLVDPIAKFNIKNSLIERLFGGTTVDIKPQGNINLTFGYRYQKVENPILTLRQQRIGNFDFDMDINMSAQGKIGEKLNLNFNYNTQATFDFDNQMKIHYDPKNFDADGILQNIEAGNVSMPLRSNLIKGAQNLFGAKVELKTGHLRTTILAAQQRSRQQSLSLQGGAQVVQFQKPIDEYDENRHFFISHWNRGGFEKSMECLPVPISLFTITRMEVWVTNDRNATENFRDIVAITDLGEPAPFLDGKVDSLFDKLNPVPDYAFSMFNDPNYLDVKNQPLPDNNNNAIYTSLRSDLVADPTIRYTDRIINYLTRPDAANGLGMRQIRDFEKVSARLLSPSEYAYNDQLGFLSINLNVQPDQVVGVAVEYTYNGIPHKIGEFSSDIPRTLDSINNNVLFVKMLKSTTANVRYPIWDLMMKNVYSVGTANVDPNEFRFDIVYEDPGKGQKRFLNATGVPQVLQTRPLLQLFGLDKLNLQNDPGPDGIFDFVPGLTINLRSGRIMFPVLEPFGKFLNDTLISQGANANDARRLVYPQLYDSTLFRAREFPELNRFTLVGSYKSSSSSEISLGTFNLPQGSVRVSAGGQQLREGVDYTVDYNIGKVRIINDAILQSGQSVNVSFEDNTLFGFQNRTMIGTRFDYEFSKDFTIGATFMNLFERPLTQKVNFGDDPINNKVYGLDFNISKETPWMTRLIDRLPLLETKEPSSITAQAEVAVLDPGYNRAINQRGLDQGGTVYIDDFEGSTANLPLTLPANQWVIASVPQGDDVLFPEGKDTTLALGANRAGLSWYVADPIARDPIDGDDPYTSLIQYQEIFPNRQLTPLEQSALRPLDVTFYPRERGPYNFEVPDGYPGFSAGLTTDGQLNLPKTRWGGFMRGLVTNDFEAANIEFIEFWMLNPYMDKTDGTPVSDPGDMYFDLGTVSEDIMRDSRQFFEQAILPSSQGGASASTRWGRVPVLPPVVNAFDNDPGRRALQDVGLDGLGNDEEKSYFQEWYNIIQSSALSPNFKNDVAADPSNDDFVFFQDQQFNNANRGMLARYRKFNNSENNSPVNNSQNLNPAATNLPDQEDLNRDQSLNENEAYFRYRIPLKKNTIVVSDNGVPTPIVGIDLNDPDLQALITDTVVFRKNGQLYVWYRFKLPLDYSQRKQIGGIQDFRSIRFIRMFWKGFSERTTFRFATLELGRNQWRRYLQPIPRLEDPCASDFFQYVPGPFDINAVNIEEHSARSPFNYTIPAGIQREQSVGAFPDVLQNEQALSMTICDLDKCDAKAIFKPLNMDLRQFDRIKMFVHAEELEGKQLDTNDLRIFIRLGSDYTRNYYEYELQLIPSFVSELPNRNPDDRGYKDVVWKPENTFDFPLDLLINTKTERNKNPNWSLGQPFIVSDPDKPNARVKVVGNPNLGLVKGVMVGVRNTDPDAPGNNKHCVEVWINELRLTGFNEQGGYAGQARVDFKLADLGNVTVAGSYSRHGWGSIEQKLLQRQREDIAQIDVSASLSLDKFLPQEWGLRLPFYTQYSNTTRTPEFDPYDLDVKLKDKLKNESDPGKRDSIKQQALDVTSVRGFNFTNVRKERRGGSKKVPLPWNIENFSFSYAQNKISKRTPFIISDNQNQYRGAIDYNYSTGLKPFTPFKKLIKNDKYLKFISEFNFNPIPNTYGFSTNLERYTQRTVWRFAGEDPNLNTYFNRRFTWERNYDLGWDISKSLRFNFDATMRSLIDEPYAFDNEGKILSRKAVRDSIIKNVLKLGRPKNYTHNASLNYTLPFKTIPMMDWVTVKASYTASYTWSAQSLKLQNLDAGTFQEVNNSRNLGNVIQNNSVRQINGDLDFTKLYDKSKYLQKINRPAKSSGAGKSNNSKIPAGQRGGRGGKDPGIDNDNDPGSIGPGGAPGGRNNPSGTGGGGKSGGGNPAAGPTGAPPSKNDPSNPRDPNNPNAGGNLGGANNPAGNNPAANPGAVPGGAQPQPGGIRPAGQNGKADPKDPNSGGNDPDDPKNPKGGKKSKDKKKEDRQPSLAERIALRPLMLIRKARFTYSETYGSIVPGFTPDARLMGMSEGFQGPGWGYVAGLQPSTEWLNEAATKGWITHRPELNQQVTRNYTQNFDAGLTLEPFRDFRIELTANKQYSRNSTELFKDQNFTLNPSEVNFQHRAQRDFGSYTISYFSMNTLFNNDINGLFSRYEDYRKVISNRLATISGNNTPFGDPNFPEYKEGYGPIHQEVLIPAFIAAYSDKDPNTVGLDIFKTLPAANWKLNYNGLSKVGNLSKIFSSIQISHGYKNTLTVNQYNTDIFYDSNNPYTIDSLNFNYVARYEIPQVIINEQMQPLLGIDVRMKNDMTFKVDFKKSRTLALSLVDYQLAESQSSGYTFGFGYRIKNVKIGFLSGKNKSKKSSKSKKKKPGASKTPPAAPPSGGSGTQPNDLNIKFDLDVRDDITINHRLDVPGDAIPTRGARTIAINPSVEYALNRRLKLRLFTDYRKTVPKTSQSFPITTLQAGLTVQFTLN